MSFQVALSNVLLTLLYIAPGYLLGKWRKNAWEHLPTLSAVLVYICGPCLPVSAFLDLDFSWQGFGDLWLFFLVTFAMQSIFLALMYAVFRKKYGDARYRVMSLASMMGNVGFFGLPVLKALLPQHPEAAGYSAMFIVSMNILVFTLGVFFLTRDKKYISLRSALLNPTVLGFCVAMPLYLTGGRHYLPSMLTDAVHLMGKMTTPLCMIILGVRLSTVPFRQLFSQPFAYGACAGKLLIFPLFCFLCVRFLPLSFAFRASVLILAATPCASIIFNLAELHRSETVLSANCVMLSTLLCFMTIPVLTLLL